MAGKKAIERDFSFLKKRRDILAILLYGSAARGEQIEGSDIDICIVAPECKDKLDLLRNIYRNLDVYGKSYDVRIFEDLPLYIRSQIIEANKAIFTREIYELYEYFYFCRKLWEDQAYRQRVTKKEMAEMF